VTDFITDLVRIQPDGKAFYRGAPCRTASEVEMALRTLHAFLITLPPTEAESMALPKTDAARKALPIFDGVLMYFPDAIAAVAAVSKAGNDQHNPGEPLHWARGKSMDQMNTAVRHMMDHGTGTHIDTDGQWHLAKAAWRLLAALQLAIEEQTPTLRGPRPYDRDLAAHTGGIQLTPEEHG
jgi:hypothetical protein